jgi:hypothetical protein
MPRGLGRHRPNLLTYIGATRLFAFGFVGFLLTFHFARPSQMT